MLRHELYRPAVVQTVSKLYEHDSDVVIEREEDSLEVLSLHAFLTCLVLIVKDGLDLSEALDDCSNLVSKEVAKVVYSVVCVLHYVMKQRGNYRLVAKTDIAYDNLCNRYRMQYIWLA